MLVVVNMIADVRELDWLQEQVRQLVTAMRGDGERVYSADLITVKDEGERISLAE